MTAPIKITVPGPPIGKGRHRSAYSRDGSGNLKFHAYTPSKTRVYDRLVRDEAALAMNGRKPFDCAVMLSLLAYFPIPKSWPKAKREAALHHTSKPDADNVLKAIADALNGIVYRDDALAVETYVRKLYDANPRVEITVQEMP